MNNENYDFERATDLKHAFLEVMTEYANSGKSLRSILRVRRLSSDLDARENATVQFLTLGVVRYQNTIDFILARCTRNEKYRSLPLRSQILLKLCLYWSRWQGMSSAVIEELLIDEDTRLMQILKRGLSFDIAKAVIKLPLIEQLSIELSHPTFIVDTLLANMAEKDAIALMIENNSATYSYLRKNQLLPQGESLISDLMEKGITLVEDSTIPGVFRIHSGMQDIIRSSFFTERKLLIQDKASVIAAKTLAPNPGETVWDACAAPGMKTQALWEMMESQGKLVATERNENRFKEAIKQSSAMGMIGVDWELGDASLCPVKGADKILIDAPCTSTGMIHSHPSFKWRLNKKTLFATMTIQNKILEGILTGYSDAPGTEIVYATCSILPHEGESQIDSILDKYPVELVDNPLIETLGYPGFRSSKQVRRMFPHIHSTDGFFIAKMRVTH